MIEETPIPSSPSLSIEKLLSTPPDTFTNETIGLVISELRRWRLAYVNGEAKPGEAPKPRKPRASKPPAPPGVKPEKLALSDIANIDID